MSGAMRPPNPIVLLDESVALLRAAPASAWLAWAVGSLPFALGVIACITEMTSSADAPAALPGHALGVAVLYLWMVSWQTVFSRSLWPALTREPRGRALPLMTAMRTQALLWSTALVLLPASLLSVAGFPWAVAFYYNAAAFPYGDREPALREIIRYASARASTWHMSAAFALSITCIVWLVALVNSAVLVIGGPLLLRTLTGQESVFTRDIQGMFNTTLLASVLTMACLAVDPLLRAMFVIRCFRVDAIRTGIDLKAAVARSAAG
ncbi:MAG TPA: hypothetical protein VFA04_19275, partial [Bryobacteraceae bacterium]|nr:hypothetical protein [Bryobacteraceae bacterium]